MTNAPSGLSEIDLPKFPAPSPRRFRGFLLACVIVIGAFSLPLTHFFKFALGSELFSHIILIPFVSLYLIWLNRDKISFPPGSSKLVAGIAFSLAACSLGWSVLAPTSGVELVLQDQLALQIFALVCCLVGLSAVFFSPATLRAVAFPLGFLVFMVPFPVALVAGIETFFQHTSASAAAALYKMAGTPFFRDGTFFQLPGINLEVAPECSGIRSSLALFITSLVAGFLFLRSPTKRIILALVVIPLAIVRNGFRIFVIGELCVHVSPDMINSYIHHQGGPIFFALSLVPFSLFLFLLVRSERRKHDRESHSAASSSLPPAAAADASPIAPRNL